MGGALSHAAEGCGMGRMGGARAEGLEEVLITSEHKVENTDNC